MRRKSLDIDASTIATVVLGTMSIAIGLIGIYVAYTQLRVSSLQLLRSMVRVRKISMSPANTTDDESRLCTCKSGLTI